MYSKEELFNIRSCWITPDGTVEVVGSENHDDELPDAYTTVEQAENMCVRVSCCWGYTAPISEIFLPKSLTTYQAQRLVEINESLLVDTQGKNNIEKKINLWHNGLSWFEILECI